MIEIKNVDFFYETAESESSLKNVSVTVPKGQVVLLCGESGSGKTTFGRLINGLIPCYYDGKMDGQVFVNKISTAGIQLHELAETVGSVFQNPKSQFYTLLTDTEIVFACENIGMEKSEIFSRFEKTVQDFHMEKLLGKNVSQLSGGEKQKIACACVSMLEPPIFILDEPTSNLDIGAIRELKKIIRKWKDSGKTILIAEHRLWWTKDLIDRVLIFREGEIAEDINAAEFWSRSPEEFRSRGLRSFSGFAPIKAGVTLTDAHYTISEFQYANGKDFSIHVPKLEIPKGAVVAVLGNNGAGKSTFAKCLCGLTKCKVQIYDGNRTYRGRELRKLSFMVFQDVNHQLFSESALEDITLGLSLSKEEKTAVAEDALRRMNLADCKDTHPMALSGGQKQRLAIAGALAAKKELILWDEAANTGQVPQLEKLVAVIRSREISLCLLYQQLAQCKAIYDKNAETILGNMDSVLFLGGREASTIKEISENWLGKATISMQTEGRSRGQSESYSQNTQRLGRELMTSSELATMPGDRCILQLRGLPPFYSKKYDLKQHPNYRFTAEADKVKNAFDLDRLIDRHRRPGMNEECEVYEVSVPDEAITDEDEDILNYDDLDDPDAFV